MKNSGLLFLAVLLLSCQQRNKEDLQNTNEFSSNDTSSFYNSCSDLQSWVGGIQGVPPSDSTKPYLFLECHTNNSFDIICVPKIEFKMRRDINPDTVSNMFYRAGKNGYKELNCFAFVLPKIKPKEPENDRDEFDYVYPSKVMIYKNSGNRWELVNSHIINSFEELGRLKLNTVFEIK
ncbi:MAG: hypothetical protein SFU87_16225 [Chitinophagaceae bacterium]|nr:hypothetical protein [Chitinophagaceae bacterium]